MDMGLGGTKCGTIITKEVPKHIDFIKYIVLMSYYFIGRINIIDSDEYQKYLDKSGEIFKKYKGEYLVVDDEPVVLEGNWDQARTVLIRFKSRRDFWDWYYSDDYQEILKHRLAGAECNGILTKGLDNS
jgi:uncharacterized protein (DUF1330 family)